MKKRFFSKKIIISLVALLLVGCAIPFIVIAQSNMTSSAVPDPTEGMTGFNTTNVYKMSHTLTELPQSFEAWIKVPTDIPDDTRVGTIFSNFKSGTNGFVIEIRNNGAPTFWYYNVANKLVRISFDADVRTGEYLHLAMVIDDANGQLRCYINGEEKDCVTETEKNLDFAFNNETLCHLPFVFGCDNRPNFPFQGSIARFAAYGNVMTAERVRSVYQNGVDTEAEDLAIYYEIPSQPSNFIPDLSGNGNHVALPSFQSEGMTFKTGDTEELMWRMSENLTAAPLSFETWIKVPTDVGNGRVGNIFSNYSGSGNSAIVFDIHINGMPRFFFRNSDGTTINTANQNTGMFDQIDVRTGEFIHLAIVNDPTNNTLSCYVNGKLAQTLTSYSNTSYDLSEVLRYPFSLGGDNRTNVMDGTSSNQYPFKGMIKSFAAYSRVLTESQIASCYANGTSVSSKGLLAYYNVTSQPATNVIEDLSGNHNYMGRFASDGTVERPEDYAYSFAIVGDTQFILEKDALNGTNEINVLYEWILKNTESKKIAAVLGLGDIIDNHSNETEWAIAREAIKKMDGKVPYYLVRGNHDNADCYNRYIGSEAYTSQFSDPDTGNSCFYEEGKVDNAYTKFIVGETKYIFMLLDYGARDSVLEWAGNVIAENHDYRVIVCTHGYLSADGEPLDDEWYSPDPTESRAYNSGKEMWEKLISRYPNIYMVLSGHDAYAEGNNILYTTKEGVNGNIVNQFLIDPQSLDSSKTENYGMVAMFYFSEDGKKVSVEYISTIKSTDTTDYLYNRDANCFEFDFISDKNNGLSKVELISSEGSTDTYRIWYTNGTFFDFTVSNGKDGVNGSDGKDGADGKTPYIGENGNWWIGTIDTGVRAEGGADTEPDYGNAIDGGSCGGNVHWSVTDKNVLIISGKGAMLEYSVGNTPWSAYTDTVEKIVLDDGITSIGKCAFYGFTALSEVKLSSSLLAIEDYAFYGCAKLYEVSVPSNTRTIGAFAFRKSGLTSLVLRNPEAWSIVGISDTPDNMELAGVAAIYIKNYYYTSEWYVAEVGVGDVIASGICGEEMIWKLTTDGTLIISGSGDMWDYRSTTMPWYGYIRSIFNVVIEGDVTSIGECAFAGANNLLGVALCEGLESVNDLAFYGCTSLKEIAIPDTVIYIADDAFKKTGLIEIPTV